VVWTEPARTGPPWGAPAGQRSADAGEWCANVYCSSSVDRSFARSVIPTSGQWGEVRLGRVAVASRRAKTDKSFNRFVRFHHRRRWVLLVSSFPLCFSMSASIGRTLDRLETRIFTTTATPCMGGWLVPQEGPNQVGSRRAVCFPARAGCAQ
jgi:hypothetical protein